MILRTNRRSILAIALGVPTFSDSPTAIATEARASSPWRLGEVVVEQAWARVTPGGSRTGAIYLTIHNKAATDDLLLAVDSSAARTTAIHESRIVDGVATMVPLPVGLPMPSHGEVVMRPGAIHIMLTVV
jgi:hypothetical protein